MSLIYESKNFEKLCKETYQKSLSISYSIFPSMAEDIVQETYLKIRDKYISTILNHPNPEGYIFRTVRNTAINYKQKNQRENKLAKSCKSGSYEPYSAIDYKIDKDIIFKLFTPKQREVLGMLIQGYKPNEIAKVMNITANAISKIRSRAREKVPHLRKLL